MPSNTTDIARQGAVNLAVQKQKQLASNVDLIAYKDLYFRSRFQEILDALSEVDLNQLDKSDSLQLRLYEVGALFEMHSVKKAERKLSELSEGANFESDNPAYLHSLARLKYLDRDYSTAGNLWNKILIGDRADYYFRAHLGLANIYFSQKRFHEIPDLIKKLSECPVPEGRDEWISFLMLQGNYYYSSGKDLEKAKHYFNEAITASVMQGWYYFLARAIFGLSCVAKASENMTALKAHLDTLQAVLKHSDNLLLKHLTNEMFGDQRVICATSFDVDYEEKRVKINGQWRSFHRTPKLFGLFLTLYGSDGFVSKSELAKVMWPRERYKARVHDPRIFNIVGRVKKIIEAYDSQPVLILSGRCGYKLATKEEK